MAKTAEHPSARRLIQDVAKRFMAARKAHGTAVNRMWLGVLIAEFTDDEIAILREMDYLSPHDEELIKWAKR